jgi:murein DD-endopeptidase MepM/ murein hydrolase activator NlpD
VEAWPGDVVRAAGDGRVVHAGPLAGRGVVSIEHDRPLAGAGPWRTTYEPVDAEVAVGERVRAGERVGVLAGIGHHCDRPCLHWGLRQGADYRDPTTLLAAPRSRLLAHLTTGAPGPWSAEGRTTTVRAQDVHPQERSADASTPLQDSIANRGSIPASNPAPSPAVLGVLAAAAGAWAFGVGRRRSLQG